MDKETLSNYGWIVICILVLSVMIALATPFGSFIRTAVENTTQGLFDVQQKAMGVAGLVVDDQKFNDQSGNSGGITVPEYDHNAPELHINNGITYKEGDVYSSGNYEYRYKRSYIAPGQYFTNPTGWSVRCINNVSNPGPILESINGEPITSMYRCFENCTSLIESPTIPNGVSNMGYAYYNCVNLAAAPVLPNGVTDMYNTFNKCINLLVAPVLPNGVTDMRETFNDCKNLKTYAGSSDADGDFSKYIIPLNVTQMYSTFANCSYMVIAPDMSNCTQLTGLSSVFKNCTSLTTAPIILSNITSVSETFYNCTSLTGVIEINATLSNNTGYYRECFAYVDFQAQEITLTGNSTFGSYDGIDNIGSSGINYCAECNGKHKSAEEEHNCHGGTATCIAKAVCASCNKEYGSIGYHTGGTATCTQKKICQLCNNEYGILASHKGGMATCQSKAVCIECNQEYGQIAMHTVHNGICTICGEQSEIESNHSPYLNSQNNVVLGTWDYSDAQSVTITITYQTEDGCDYIYLKSGDNYIDLDGNITSTETKISGTTKTTKTFTTTALTGSVIFRTDGSISNYYGVQVIVTPNY